MAFTDHVKTKIGADTKGLQDGLAKAETRAAKFKKVMTSRLAGGLGAAAFAAAAKQSINFGAAIGDLSDRLGVNAEFLQSVQHAAEQNGISSDAAAIAMQRFTRRVAEAQANGGTLAETLNALGIKMRDSEGNARNTEAMFQDFGDALTNMENPAEKLRVAFQFLDTEGAALTQMFQKGKPSIKEYGEQARQSGLILKNETVKTLQNASGELEKASRSFSVLSAEVLPGLIKILRNAKLGFDLIVLAFKSFPTTAELVGKAILTNIVDNFKLLIKEAALVAAKLNAFKIEFNPFAEQSEIDARKKQVLAAQADVEKARKMADLTLQQRQKQIVALDHELAADAKKVAKEKAKLQQEFNEINGRGLKTRERITAETNKEKQAIAEINGERLKEEIVLTRTLDKIKALKAGGEDALKVVQERHKMEDKIQALMGKGAMNRAEATKLAKQLIAAENEELRLHEKIKEEQKQKVDLKNQEADRKQIAEQLKEEAKLHQDARQQMKQTLEVLKLRANGQNKEADLLEKNIENRGKVADLMAEMGIGEQAAIKLLNEKLGLEQKITDEKINQGIEEIKNQNMQGGEDLNNMGATERGKKLRDMDKEERQRAKDQLRADRLQKVLDDPDRNKKLTDREREKIKQNLEKLKNDLLTDEQKKQIKELEKQRKKAKELADKQKKELDNRQKEIKAEADKKKKELKQLEAKAKKALEEAGADAKKKMTDAFNAGEKAIKNAGTAIVQAINRLNFQALEDHNKKKENGSGEQENLAGLQGVLQASINNLGSKIATEVGKIDLKTGTKDAMKPPVVNNAINLEVNTDELANDSTMQSILEALKGKFKNES